MTEITLLDGSIGQELVKRTGEAPTPLWSTQVLLDRPDLVSAVHLDYLAAGATVATTNSYAVHRDRLRNTSNHYASQGQPIEDIEDQFEALLDASVAAAEVVRGKSRIAGAIGPLGASYRADIHPPFDEAVPLYAEVVDRLAPHVDVILFETVPSIAAAKAALAACHGAGKPVWLAFTVEDADGSTLRSGEAVADAVEVAKGADAVLINCSLPEAIPASLDALAEVGCPIGAYANGFTRITDDFKQGNTTAAALQARQDLSPEVYADHAMSWVAQGATILGGCCEVGPAHIAELANRLRAAGHTIV